MSQKINKAYSFSREDDSIISGHFTNYTDWHKDVFNPVKENLKNHLRVEQNNMCCYCKEPLGFDLKQVDIEHIIAKSQHSEFTFHPFNLALSCPACNTSKGDSNVLKKAIKRYPRSGSNIVIIHPHYDNYNEHIKVLNESVYVGKDDKGCETIRICKLYRLHNVLEKSKKFITKPSLISQLLEEIRMCDEDQAKSLVDALINKINERSG